MYYLLTYEWTPQRCEILLREFKCQRCKPSCCTKVEDGIVLKPHEVDRLAWLMGISKHQFKDKFTFVKGDKRHMICPCPFYSEEKDCTIHPQRPDVCRQFPFNRTYLVKGKNMMTVCGDCPAGKEIGERYGIKPEAVKV